MLERIEGDHGDPADYLPYDSAEGGYQAAPTCAPCELITEHLPLALAPRPDDVIQGAIHDRTPAADWCDRDPIALGTFEVLN